MSDPLHELRSALPSGLFIEGEWQRTQAEFPVVNPATGEVIAQVADGGVSDGITALDAACDTAEAWAETTPRERSEILARTFALVHERADLFAGCMTMEMGKPLAEAHGEVRYGAEFLRWFAEEAVRVRGEYSIAPASGQRIMTMRVPVGPVYAITPWNFPLAMATRKIAPALAAGCTVVIKPASETPLTTLLLMRALEDAGLPAGVVNCITTTNSSGVSDAILADSRLRKLTFTGSTPVGKALLRSAADGVLRTSMELGGNAPFLVLPSADLDRAVTGAIDAKMRNMGEACTAANRFYVHASLADEFAARLAERMAALTVGNGLADGTSVGPMVTEKQRSSVLDLVDDAVDRGGQLMTGGQAVPGDGFFVEPTVVHRVPVDARCQQEEIFGPFAPITTFDDLDDAIGWANATEFGLAAYVFAAEAGEALYVIERLQSGMVAWNTGILSDAAAPFGGVKQSGLGREGGAEGISEFLETKYVAIRP
ncbi:NAD-dependent succinate-semialdehyde dehydrogenase [Enemella sp. A6]|uniref:NAD-dependent succinate-semialdehyde dehydrogenase n=1 Tax=Enemella sp. A6 TaxID=3440152 RepID=UPI003EBE2650